MIETIEKQRKTSTLKKVTEKGKKFIINAQNFEKGNWSDSFSDTLVSDVWTTGYILSQNYLDSGKIFNLDISKAIDFLKEYSFTGKLKSDESTRILEKNASVFVMRALLKYEGKIAYKTIENWYAFQNRDGGFRAYYEKKEMVNSISSSGVSNADTRLKSHFCVSAASYLFFCEAGINNSILQLLRRYLKNKMTDYDASMSYCWKEEIYAFNLLYKGALIVGDYEMISLILPHIWEFTNGDCFLSIKKELNCFYLGVLLETLTLSSQLVERYRDQVDQIVETLLTLQLGDGSWPRSMTMKIADLTVMNPIHPNIEGNNDKEGANIIVQNFDRLFTTSVCISGLVNYEQIKKRGL